MSSAVDLGFEKLLEFVRDARGFDYTGYRRPTLMRRFEKRMQAVGSPDWDAYHQYLESHPDEFVELFNVILINVTGFFRDEETWTVVATEVIPKLLEEHESIRVWSAGCASGEEPYTISMLFAEALGERDYKKRVKIYATDVDEGALAEAREAVYSSRQLADVPEALRERYFLPANDGFAFRGDLRRTVIFGRNDLHKDPPISRVDLLVSRNTLMYFGSDLQERILANYYFALNRGGFLVVGKAEALQKGRQLFKPYNLKRRIFQRDGAAEPAFHVPSRPPKGIEEPGADLGDAAFEHAPVAQLVIDPDNRVVAVNQVARALFDLKLRDIGRPLQDLELSYRPVDIRSLIDETRRNLRSSVAKDIAWESPKGTARWFDVSVTPLAGTGERLAGVSVSFVDATIHRALERQLEHARRELQTAYEELQSTVEELETTNEELQSTNEELETTNEELQSTNEELETMNEELQSTNEELETMNDELRERTDETLRANWFLTSVLSSIQQAVVVVDDELRVIGWSSQATDLFGLRDDEAEGQHLLNIDVGLPVAVLREPVRRTLAGVDDAPVAVEGHNRRGQPVHYTVAFAPLAGRDPERPAGVILLLTAERTD
ncbi:MAG: PAS domain-containing protein [Actinobacteria bacterium]|nr:MAG: PAS domain-containing protein [Actinomycetota bacterium]